MPLSWSVVKQGWAEAEYRVAGTVSFWGGHDEFLQPFATAGYVSISLPGYSFLSIVTVLDWNYQGSGEPAVCWFASLPDRDVWHIVSAHELEPGICTFEAKVTGTMDLMGAMQEIQQPAAPIGLHLFSGNHSAALTSDLDLYLRPVINEPQLTVRVGEMSHTVDLGGPVYDGTIMVSGSIGALVNAFGTLGIVDNRVYGYNSWDYIGRGALNTADIAFITATYSRPQGVCEETRSFGRHGSADNTWGENVQHHCRARVGGGSVSFYGAYRGDGGALYGPLHGTSEADHTFHDYCGPYTIPNGVRFANMGADNAFQTPPDSRRPDLEMTSLERHPGVAWSAIEPPEGYPDETYDHEHAEYSLDDMPYLDPSKQSEAITYRGHWRYVGSATKSGMVEEFFDLPTDTRVINKAPNINDHEGYFVEHGGARITNIASSWHADDPKPEYPPYGHYDEPVIQEPSHPAWTEDGIHWPDQAVDESGNLMFNEDTGEPIWDNSTYCRNKGRWHDDRVDLVCLPWHNALKITLVPPGTKRSVLDPLDWLGDWSLINCSEVSGEFGIHWTPDAGQKLTALLPHEKIFPTGARLSGFRYLKVPWDTATAGAEFELSIGGHTWSLNVADIPEWQAGKAYAVDDNVRRPGTFGLFHCTTAHTSAASWQADAANWAAGAVACIDLCHPDSSTVEPAPVVGAIDKTRYATDVQSVHPHTEDFSWDIVMPEGKNLIRFFIQRFEPDNLHRLEVYDGVTLRADLDEFTTRYSQLFPNPQGYLITDWCEIQSGVAHVSLVSSGEWATNYGVSFLWYEVASASSAQLSAQQSIAPYEKPLDRSVLNLDGTNQRADDESSIFRWEFPSGWGVGRIDSVKLESLTDGADLWLGEWNLYRKTVAEGGFAQVLVMPHEPYNDWRSFAEDFCWQDAGETLNGGANGTYRNYKKIVPKLWVVVDGAVALEMPAGYVEEDNRDTTIGGGIEYWSPFYFRTKYRFVAPDWITGWLYHVDDYVSYHGIQYRCISQHTANESVKPPHTSYWTPEEYVPTGYPLADYRDPRSPWACPAITNCHCGTADVESFWYNHGWTTFLRDGIYCPDESNEVTIPADIQAWRLHIRPGTMFSPETEEKSLADYVLGWQKVLRGCLTGLAFNGSRPAANATVKISAPNDDPDTPGSDPPTLYYATTNSLGWFISPAIKTRFVSAVSGAGTPTPVALPVRSRLYSRMASVDIVPSGGHAAIDREPACRIYRVFASSGEILLDHSDDGGQTWQPVPALSVAAGESPAVSASWRNYQSLVVVYVSSGALMKRVSADEGETWGDAMQLCDGTHPFVYRDPATGHKLLFYYSGGSLYVRRTPDEFVHWIKTDGTLVAVSPEPPVGDVAFEVASDAADDTPAIIDNGLADHKVMLVYQKSDGTLGCVFSQANGMPPYA